jgi:Response regulator containing a CheY-like receiver domain and an HTH DNA-binding domain
VFVVKKKKSKLCVEGAPVDNAVAEEKSDISSLSDREKEVYTLLLEGKQRNEIASDLFISENTVNKHISSIYQKLDVKNKSDLFSKHR